MPLKQAEESSCQMQPALLMMQSDAGDLRGPRVTLQQLWAQSCQQGQAAGARKTQKEKTRARPQEGKTYEPTSRSSISNMSPGAHSTGRLLEQLSLLDLAQGAGTEPLFILCSPWAAQLGWHSLPLLCPSIVFSCWIATLDRDEVWALNEWEKGQLTGGSS